MIDTKHKIASRPASFKRRHNLVHSIASMLSNNKPVPPAKPPIAAKPKILQKTNYIIVGKNENQSVVAASRNGKKNNELYGDSQPLLHEQNSSHANHISLPSSPPNYSDCTNDCCGILNNKQLDCIQRQKNKKNGAFSNGVADDENRSSFHHNNDNHKSAVDKSFKTSSQSFDSLSSSSGGFKDYDYVSKTRVAYECYDKEDNFIHNNQTNDPEAPPSKQMPIGHSKVQEMKTKLLAQQLQQQQNHVSNEPSVPITRQQYQKSSKELEKVLGMRIEKKPPQHDKLVKRLSKSFDDAESNVASISNQIGANISKHIQQKLTEEMKQQCEIIKEKFLIEKIPVQQHYNDYTVEHNRTTFSIIFRPLSPFLYRLGIHFTNSMFKPTRD